ncbi:uncharacterized protein F4807DRAFT_328814 [Annulohypoxylon truncatum]|uniref:uncharacterized protein n=1 Tax=Annulohypoxylon truncatum TaxID=327061 RepID=UPI002007968B|nr:uncharacterized protein F4807DRAFT_328814 [Annulohypoxylon truncatum]KAI1204525.1 hypothetical protein F4807DRAFT_328814 [Annulohypoxylon truncatum]
MTETASNTQPPTAINLRAPSKYLSPSSKANPTTTASAPFVSPPLEWLWRTWIVTHSTLSMWRSARNVRITYAPYKPVAGANDNLVEYEKRSGKGGVKTVVGIEKPDPVIPGAWTWRGKGLLAIASSHWEVLGWGERPLRGASGEGNAAEGGGEGEGIERWAVTWFAPTLFTQEGVDIYSDRKEGLSKETAEEIIKVLKELKDAPKVVELVEKHMQEVDISLPWKERK